MDRRHLEYFVAVAELGSFTRAAAALSIAQPSLSHAIAWLERDLGSKLFERHGRGVSLTPSGEALLEPARRALRAFQVARGAVRSVSEGDFGQVSIITNTLWAVDPLAGMIGRFRTLHRGVQLTIADPARRVDVLDAVRLGGAELGLLDGPPPGGRLSSRWVADHELVAVLPSDAVVTGETTTTSAAGASSPPPRVRSRRHPRGVARRLPDRGQAAERRDTELHDGPWRLRVRLRAPRYRCEEAGHRQCEFT